MSNLETRPEERVCSAGTPHGEGAGAMADHLRDRMDETGVEHEDGAATED